MKPSSKWIAGTTVTLIAIAAVVLVYRVPSSLVPESVESRVAVLPANGPSASTGRARLATAEEAEKVIRQANLLRDYSHLQKLSRTDPAIAYAFAIDLWECSRIGGNLAAIAEDAESSAADPDLLEGFVTEASASAKRCQGLTPEQIGRYIALLEAAADSGNVKAQLAYPGLAGSTILSQDSIKNSDAIARYKRKSMSYLNRAASVGEPAALFDLAMSSQDGIITSQSDLNAYKYLVAYERTGPRRSAQPLIEKLEQRLSLEEQDQARKQADALYEHCCS